MGRALGRAIYLLDALEDLTDDAVNGTFNPCISDGAPCPLRVTRARRALFGALTDVEQAVERLPWYRNHDLVTATVAGLRGRAHAAAEQARRHATPEGQITLARWVLQPRWVHAAAALMTAWAALWTAFGSTALAAGRQVTRTAVELAPGWLWPRADQCPCDSCSKGCSDCGKGCSDCGKGCSDCGDACSDCGKQCGDCGDQCSSCGSGCSGMLLGGW
jgi:hypothetical protein